jgi:purine nucleosidase
VSSPGPAQAPIPLILDVDTGVDDAAALLLAATDPRVELDAVLATWGNTTVELAARNCLHVLEAAGNAAPVYVGADVASGPAPPVVEPTIIMGEDGLADLGLPSPLRKPEPDAAADALVERTRDRPGELTLVCLAPLTTLAQAVELDPGVVGRLAGLVILGGTLAGGNSTPAAEANIAHDPGAAATVFEAFGAATRDDDSPVARMVPLEAATTVFTTELLDLLTTTTVPGAALLHRILTKMWPMASLEAAGHGILLADLAATACAIRPALAQWRAYPVAVDTGGSAAWGATIVDRRLDRFDGADLDPTILDLIDELLWTFPAKWSVATSVHEAALLGSIRTWLTQEDA